MQIEAFFDPATFTLTYVVHDPATGDAVVIDPVLDFDSRRWAVTTKSAEEVQRFAREKSLNVRWVLDTHAHADHLTGMDVLKRAFGAPTAIGAGITKVQQVFASAFDVNVPADGSQWDELLGDGQTLEAGSLAVTALHTPGHTPACLTYSIGDALFTGDALFMPDYGTGRTDFPGGSPEDLYDSITGKLYSRPDASRVFVGHDYQPGGRELAYQTTIGASKEQNIRLRGNTSRADFVTARRNRDAELSPPNLILQSLQINIDAGRLPEPAANGRRYLKMPLGLFNS